MNSPAIINKMSKPIVEQDADSDSDEEESKSPENATISTVAEVNAVAPTSTINYDPDEEF